MGKRGDRNENWPDYYDHSNILEDLAGLPVRFSLDPELQKDILADKRVKKLKNITSKIDPVQI